MIRKAPWYSTSLLGLALLGSGCQGPHRREQAFEPFNQVGMPLPMDAYFTKYSPQSYADMTKAMTGRNDATNGTEGTKGGNGARGGDPKYEVRRLYEEYVKSVDSDRDLPRARELRDGIAFKMMTHIKHYHEGQTDDVYEITAGLESFFDLTALALTGAASATGGASAKTALSVAAAGVLGTKATLGSSILADQTKFAIIEHMRAIRTRREAEIIGKLNSQSVDAYPLEETVKDLYDFLSDGSLKAAVAELVQGAERARSEANAKLAEAESLRASNGQKSAQERAARISARADLLAATSRRLAEELAGTNAQAFAGIRTRAMSISETAATRRASLISFEGKDAALAIAKSHARDAEAVLAAIKAAGPSRSTEQPAAEAKVASLQAAVKAATTDLENAQSELDATFAAIDFLDGQVRSLDAELNALMRDATKQ